MNKIHRHLKLQHHRLTGKLLHHKHTSYRSLALLFVVVAATIVGLNIMAKATADSFLNVYVTVPEPAPALPADISIPAEGSTLTTAQTTVAGSCPIATPQVAVSILVDGIESGSGICDDTNDFVITVTIAPGTHELIARVYTVQNRVGADSEPITITYKAADAGHTVSNAAALLTFKPDANVLYLDRNPATVWSGQILGDFSAASALVEWGDGSRSSYDITSGSQSFNHTYPNLSSHNMHMTVVTPTGITSKQFAVVAYRKAPLVAATATSNKPFGASTVFGLYGLFVTLFALSSIAWILEHKKTYEAAPVYEKSVNKLHHHLHLQHHQHTGRKLDHRHTSYRGLVIVFGVAAAFIIGLNLMARVTADSIYVYATNPAPIPTTAPIITSPSTNTIIHTSPLIISGTCPAVMPHVIVVISIDGHETSSVACDSSNNFSIPVNIGYGEHVIVAKTYTITNDAGPDSQPIHINYPESAYQVPHTSTYPDMTPDDLAIHSQQQFIVYGPGKDAVWIGNISGGTPPYRIHINWGDNSSDNYTVTGVDQYLTHHYELMQAYVIIVTASDTQGEKTTTYMAAVTPYRAPFIAGDTSIPGSPWGGTTMLGVYGAYLLLLAYFGLLWIRRPAYSYARIAPNRRGTSRQAHGHRL